MDMGNTLAFLVFPYISLTVFCLGHGYRYLTDRYGWTAKSSEFLEKEHLFYGAMIFHLGIILAFLGHFAGLLIPQRFLDAMGIDSATHTLIAHYSGLVAGGAAFVGLVLLLRRRISFRRIHRTTTINDYITLVALLVVVALGLFNVFFGEYDVLHTVAPWIRSILLLFSPPRTDAIRASWLQSAYCERLRAPGLFPLQPTGAHLERSVRLFFPGLDSFPSPYRGGVRESSLKPAQR